MSKYLQAILFAVFIFIMEAVPFLYKEDYAMEDLKWGWIVGMPIVFLIGKMYYENKSPK